MEAENTKALPTLTFEDLKGRLDTRYSLVYVDYRDDLDEHMEDIQKLIHGEDDAMFDVEDSYSDQRYDNAMEAIKELQKEVESEFDLEDGDLDDLFEEHSDELRYAIEELDDSNIIQDLIRNTSNPVMFYDTGMNIGDYTDPIKERLRDVKKALRIPQKNKEFDSRLRMMCEQASYGGQLVVYFRGDLDEWITWSAPDYNTISFKGTVSIAIVNHWNGSGDSTEIEHEFSLPYNKENVFIDETIKYNYTYEVCGMSSDWCDGTIMERSIKKTKKKAERSATNDHLDQEAKYNSTFKAGSCTPGDMDYKRHRNVEYINNYPCGSRCKDCGTFWID